MKVVIVQNVKLYVVVVLHIHNVMDVLMDIIYHLDNVIHALIVNAKFVQIQVNVMFVR